MKPSEIPGASSLGVRDRSGLAPATAPSMGQGPLIDCRSATAFQGSVIVVRRLLNRLSHGRVSFRLQTPSVMRIKMLSMVLSCSFAIHGDASPTHVDYWWGDMGGYQPDAAPVDQKQIDSAICALSATDLKAVGYGQRATAAERSKAPRKIVVPLYKAAIQHAVMPEIKAQNLNNLGHYYLSLGDLGGYNQSMFALNGLHHGLNPVYASRPEMQLRADRIEQERDLYRATVFVLLAIALGWWITRRFRNVRRGMLFQRLLKLTAMESDHSLSNRMYCIKRAVVVDGDLSRTESLLNLESIYERALATITRNALVSLAADADVRGHYVNLQKGCMRSSWRYEEVIEGIAPKHIAVPPCLLQPMIENALWHGINQMPDGGLVKTSIRSKGRSLVLTVEDNGGGSLGNQDGADSEALGARGLGHLITRGRLDVLEQLFPNQVEFRYEQLAPGTRVTLVIPMIPIDEAIALTGGQMYESGEQG